MDDFFRPEVRAFFRHWREVIFAIGFAVFGIWWALTGTGITQWLGIILLCWVLVGRLLPCKGRALPKMGMALAWCRSESAAWPISARWMAA